VGGGWQKKKVVISLVLFVVFLVASLVGLHPMERPGLLKEVYRES